MIILGCVFFDFLKKAVTFVLKGALNWYTAEKGNLMKRKIYLLLTEFPDTGTKIVKAMTGVNYPHASIGLDENTTVFYSFVTKGFIAEKISRYLKPGKQPFPCKLYELSVSQETYSSIRDTIDYFLEFRHLFHYSRSGLALSLLNLPYKRNRFGFFCSQFVAYILQRNKEIKLNKSINRYFSDDLSAIYGMRLKYQGNLKNMIDVFCKTPCLE